MWEGSRVGYPNVFSMALLTSNQPSPRSSYSHQEQHCDRGRDEQHCRIVFVARGQGPT